jgi:hypothetical protein
MAAYTGSYTDKSGITYNFKSYQANNSGLGGTLNFSGSDNQIYSVGLGGSAAQMNNSIAQYAGDAASFNDYLNGITTQGNNYLSSDAGTTYFAPPPVNPNANTASAVAPISSSNNGIDPATGLPLSFLAGDIGNPASVGGSSGGSTGGSSSGTLYNQLVQAGQNAQQQASAVTPQQAALNAQATQYGVATNALYNQAQAAISTLNTNSTASATAAQTATQNLFNTVNSAQTQYSAQDVTDQMNKLAAENKKASLLPTSTQNSMHTGYGGQVQQAMLSKPTLLGL